MPDMHIPYETPYCDEEDGCTGGGGTGEGFVFDVENDQWHFVKDNQNIAITGSGTGTVFISGESGASFSGGNGTLALTGADGIGIGTEGGNVEIETNGGLFLVNGSPVGNSPFVLIASSTFSPSFYVDKADFVTDGSNDEVEFQAAMDSLHQNGVLGGGTILLAPGGYQLDADILYPNTSSGPVPGLITIKSLLPDPIFTQIILNNAHIVADTNASVGLEGVIVLWSTLPATGALIDFGQAANSWVNNIVIGSVGPVDLAAGLLLLDVTLDHGGYVRGVRTQNGLNDIDAPAPVDALTFPAIRIDGSGGTVQDIHLALNNAGTNFPDPTHWIAFQTGINTDRVRITGGGGISLGGQNDTFTRIDLQGPNSDGIIFNGLRSRLSDSVVSAAQGGAGRAGIRVQGVGLQVNDNIVFDMGATDYSIILDAGGVDAWVYDNDARGGAAVHDVFDDGATNGTIGTNLFTTP